MQAVATVEERGEWTDRQRTRYVLADKSEGVKFMHYRSFDSAPL